MPLVGLAAEAPRAYFSLSAESGVPCDIGIITSGLGIDPAAVLLDNGQSLAVGHDDWITVVNMRAVSAPCGTFLLY